MSQRKTHIQRGMALLIVLWTVAALSLLVTGLVQSVRREVKLAASSRDFVVADALGQAAIHLVLRQLVAKPEAVSSLVQVDTLFQGVAMKVQVLPLSGLIDINSASEALLSSLFVVAGKRDSADAEALARAVIEYRAQKNGRGQPRGFEAIEDLLQVPGVVYPLYAKLKSLITADYRGSGRVNPLAAPSDVLVVLAGGDWQRALQISQARDAGQVGVDTTSLNANFIDSASTKRFRLVARVPLGNGAWLLSSRVVDLGDGAKTGLPWRTLNVERRVEPALSKG